MVDAADVYSCKNVMVLSVARLLLERRGMHALGTDSGSLLRISSFFLLARKSQFLHSMLKYMSMSGGRQALALAKLTV